MEPWLDLVVKIGLPSALVLWYTWQTGVREQALRLELASLQGFVRETMADKIDDSTRAIVANTAVLDRIERRIEQEHLANAALGRRDPDPRKQ